MFRTAAALFMAGLAASPALAGTYSGTLVTPSSERIITRSIVWNCAGATCEGETNQSRPLVLCQSLAKRAGRLAAFAVDGRGFTAEDLNRCNALAKGGNEAELANAR